MSSAFPEKNWGDTNVEIKSIQPLVSPNYQELTSPLLYENKDKVTLTDMHLVLDLDLTCVCTGEDYADFLKLNPKENSKLSRVLPRFYQFSLVDGGLGSKAQTSPWWGITRPHLDEFLIFAGQYFASIHIWSAGTTSYVDAIRRHIFAGKAVPATITYSRPHCDKDAEGNLYKPLVKLYQQNVEMNATNTLIIDDYDVASQANMDNAIQIPVYKPEATVAALSAKDDAFPRIMHWLMQPEVVLTEDVRKLDKSKIFV